MGLRNVPTDEPGALADLISSRPGMVASRALTRGTDVAMTLMSFSAGESVSEEVYPEDVMYLLAEGSARITLPDREVIVGEGEVLAVPAGIQHAVELADPDRGIKLLQVHVPID